MTRIVSGYGTPELVFCSHNKWGIFYAHKGSACNKQGWLNCVYSGEFVIIKGEEKISFATKEEAEMAALVFSSRRDLNYDSYNYEARKFPHVK